MKGPKQPTLCWDCARAYGGRDTGCSWSRRFVPVKGWDAEPTVMHAGSAGETESYCVRKCPEFVRDGYGGGARRLKEGPNCEIHL